MPMKTRLLALFALVIFFSDSRGAEYLGADAALARVKSAATTTKKDDSKDSTKKIAADLDAFQAASGLAPKEAATQWLTLVQRLYSLGPSRYSGSDSYVLDFDKFVTALPGPPAWVPLRDAIAMEVPKDKSEEVRKYTQQWFAHRLLGDTAALQA